MLIFKIAPVHESNTPGNFAQIYKTPSLVIFASWQGNPDVVTLERFEKIFKDIKENPQHFHSILPSHFLLIIISGDNDNATLKFYGSVKLTIARGTRVVILEKDCTGKFLPTDLITFQSSTTPNFPNSPNYPNHAPIEIPLLHHTTPQEQLVNTSYQLHSPSPISLNSSFTSNSELRTTISQLFTNRRRSFYLLAIILLVFISSLFYQLRSKTFETKQKIISGMEQNLNNHIAEAKTLNEVNSSLARSQLLQVREDFLAEAQKQFGDFQNTKFAQSDKLVKLLNSLDNEIATISKIYKIESLETHYDTSLLRANTNLVSASLHQGQIITVDGNSGTLFKIGTANKSGEIISTQDNFKNIKTIDFSGDQISGFKQDTIVGYPKTNYSISKSDAWGNIVSMRAFGANIYLLDPIKNAIWKYAPTDSGYANPRSYLGEGLTINLSEAIDLAINGEVIVITKTGGVIRFSAGIPQTTNIAGIDKSLSNPTSIFANESTDYIYILDTGNNRVVVLDKKGNYYSQYLLPTTYNLQPTSSILADEDSRKVFLTSGSKILSFDLK